MMKTFSTCILLFTFGLIGTAQEPTSVQGLIGVTFFEQGSIQFNENSVLQEEIEGNGDLPTLFSFGVAGFYSLGPEAAATSFGVDYGGLLGFGGQVDSYAFVNGSGVVQIDSDVVLADLFLGLFISQNLGEKARVYLSAGGQFVWASIESDYDENPTNGNRLRYTLTDTGTGLGAYVRGGIEFNYRNEGTFGLGVRYATATVDFGGNIGDVDMEPLQLFVTYTQKF